MIAVASTNEVTLSSLTDSITGSAVNDATVTAVLMDSTGATVYSFSMPYVAASSGNYRGEIPAATAAALRVGATYTIQLTITSSGNTLIVNDLDTAWYQTA